MTIAERRIPSIRLVPDNATVLQELGPLANLVGTWEGRGFNLIARPDFVDRTDLYLQLNHTHETFRVSSIASAIPNRGFGQEDISLFGVDYLDKISDVSPPEGTGGALHLEPGLWVYQPDPPTTFPPENVDPAQLVHRMATIPHGNAVLASGIAQPFTGAPTLATGTATYNGSIFPSFNSTPFGAGGPLNAAGSSAKATQAANPNTTVFNEYDLGVKADLTNPRSPFPASTPELPDSIDGVGMQELINDPILLLQAQIERQQADGDEFEGIALNIASRSTVDFRDEPNSSINGPSHSVSVPGADGGVENISFLEGVPDAQKLPVNNAHTALVYATFWITTVHPRDRAPYQQLQYAQMVELDFPIFTLLHGTPSRYVDLGWPHITVATLRKSFNS